MTALLDTTDHQPRSRAVRAGNADFSPKAPCFREQLASAYHGIESDITDVFYAGEILHHLMTDFLSPAGSITLSDAEGSMLLHAMHLMTNRARDLKDKYYAGYKAVPTEGTA